MKKSSIWQTVDQIKWTNLFFEKKSKNSIKILENTLINQSNYYNYEIKINKNNLMFNKDIIDFIKIKMKLLS